ncbi:MAG: hypothetical protein ABI904_07775 [Chloroflexota bacterium]
MRANKRKISGAFLLLGMTFLVIGIATNKTIFSMAAIACVLVSLVLGGRWMRPRRFK